MAAPVGGAIGGGAVPSVGGLSDITRILDLLSPAQGAAGASSGGGAVGGGALGGSSVGGLLAGTPATTGAGAGAATLDPLGSTLGGGGGAAATDLSALTLGAGVLGGTGSLVDTGPALGTGVLGGGGSIPASTTALPIAGAVLGGGGGLDVFDSTLGAGVLGGGGPLATFEPTTVMPSVLGAGGAAVPTPIPVPTAAAGPVAALTPAPAPAAATATPAVPLGNASLATLVNGLAGGGGVAGGAATGSPLGGVDPGPIISALANYGRRPAATAATPVVTRAMLDTQLADSESRTATPPAAGAQPRPSGSAEARKHTVKAGETLATLAKRYESTASELAKLNSIGAKAKLVEGQVLILPA